MGNRFQAENELTFSSDCGNILSALNFNQQKVKKTLRHFQQAPVQTISPRQVVSDFGFDKVKRALASSKRWRRAPSSPLIERRDARVLSCSDSMGLETCRSLQSVLTTNGLGLGFNSENTKRIMLNSSTNCESISPFLDEEIMEM